MHSNGFADSLRMTCDAYAKSNSASRCYHDN